MANFTRLGLKVFDPLEILEGGRIRRDLLLVDKLAFDESQLSLARGYAELLCKLHDKDPSKVLRRFDEDWEQLHKLGLLQCVSMGEAQPSTDMRREIDKMDQVALRCLERKQPYQVTLPNGRTTMIDPAGSYMLNKTRADLHRARCLAVQLSQAQEHVIPLATGPIATIFENGDRDASVLRVVLSNLPIPDATTPLESIIAFTTDADVASKLSRLRAWMVDMAVSPLSAEQIQTKLEAALADYRASMTVHKCRTALSTIELVVVTSAEILENIVRLKFSEVAKKFFKLLKEDCSLTEAELASPGREIAFVDSTSAFFLEREA